MDSIESRRTIRKDISLKGSFKIKDSLEYKLHIYKEPIDLTLSDVALLGCGFVTTYYLPKGLILFVKVKSFPVPSEGTARETKNIEFTAKVMSCRTTPSRTNRVGVEFVDIEKEYLEMVKRYLGVI